MNWELFTLESKRVQGLDFRTELAYSDPKSKSARTTFELYTKPKNIARYWMKISSSKRYMTLAYKASKCFFFSLIELPYLLHRQTCPHFNDLHGPHGKWQPGH